MDLVDEFSALAVFHDSVPSQDAIEAIRKIPIPENAKKENEAVKAASAILKKTSLMSFASNSERNSCITKYANILIHKRSKTSKDLADARKYADILTTLGTFYDHEKILSAIWNALMTQYDEMTESGDANAAVLKEIMTNSYNYFKQ